MTHLPWAGTVLAALRLAEIPSDPQGTSSPAADRNNQNQLMHKAETVRTLTEPEVLRKLKEWRTPFRMADRAAAERRQPELGP